MSDEPAFDIFTDEIAGADAPPTPADGRRRRGGGGPAAADRRGARDERLAPTTVVRKEPSKKLGPAEAPAIPPFSLQAAGPVLTPLVAAPIKVAGADTTTQAK